MQAKLRTEKRSLEQTDLSESFKKALLVIQSQDSGDQASKFDELFSIGKLPNNVTSENMDLVKETIDVLFQEVLPQGRSINPLINAFRFRRI